MASELQPSAEREAPALELERQGHPARRATICIAVAAAAAALAAGCGGSDDPPEVEVPQVLGLDVGAAAQRLERSGLTAAFVPMPAEGADCVVTNQGRHERVPRGSTVTLTISCRLRVRDVPDVVGRRADDAERALTGADLTPVLRPRPDDPSLCRVTEQDPEAEETVDPGVVVTLRLECSRGVPDVVDDPVDEARRRIRRAGLRATIEDEPEDLTRCRVAAQDPEAGDRVGDADEVRLEVECVIPDVVGQDARTARSTLERSGFEASFDPSPADPSECTVSDQDESGRAPPLTFVVLEVSCPD